MSQNQQDSCSKILQVMDGFGQQALIILDQYNQEVKQINQKFRSNIQQALQEFIVLTQQIAQDKDDINQVDNCQKGMIIPFIQSKLMLFQSLMNNPLASQSEKNSQQQQ